MLLNNFNTLAENIADADMVLVGLGEEWVLSTDKMQHDLEERNIDGSKMFSLAGSTEAYDVLVPFLEAYYYKNFIPQRLERAYKNLRKLLEGKNYFVVSLTIDPYLINYGFDEHRIVNPCGSTEKIQCACGCSDWLAESSDLTTELHKILQPVMTERCEEVKPFRAEDILQACMDVIKRKRCPQCGNGVSLNTLAAEKYREEGYLPQWDTYMKWLQGTLNKKLCVIEAGVGMMLPSVIRWPFEKTVFYNQKASMFRIHNKFYQINEEIAERSFSCEKDSVQVFAEESAEVIL
jgi:NAD-dependent SIR2 family protein deacetylase